MFAFLRVAVISGRMPLRLASLSSRGEFSELLVCIRLGFNIGQAEVVNIQGEDPIVGGGTHSSKRNIAENINL